MNDLATLEQFIPTSFLLIISFILSFLIAFFIFVKDRKRKKK